MLTGGNLKCLVLVGLSDIADPDWGWGEAIFMYLNVGENCHVVQNICLKSRDIFWGNNHLIWGKAKILAGVLFNQYSVKIAIQINLFIYFQLLLDL